MLGKVRRACYHVAMANVLFIIGAGAAAPSGCPVMQGFFRQTQLLMDRAELKGFEHEYRRVQAFRYKLARSLGTADIDIDNLEVVFNAIEMADTLGQDGGFEAEETKGLRDALVRIIVGTLENSQRFRVAQRPQMTGFTLGGRVEDVPPESPPERPRLDGVDGYSDLVEFAETLIAKHAPHDVAFMTFNYDMGLEVALRQAGRTVAYGLDDENSEEDAALVLKLHGSLNWFHDSKRGRIVPIEWNPSLPSGPMDFVDGIARVVAPASTVLSAAAFEQGAETTPWIVPPTESKREHRDRMRSIWRQAAIRIRSADAIVVIGYSLPHTDQFFRQFFALACVQDNVDRTRLLQGMWVINPDPEVGPRFENLLGSYARRKFRCLLCRLGPGLEHLRQHVVSRTGGHMWCEPEAEIAHADVYAKAAARGYGPLGTS